LSKNNGSNRNAKIDMLNNLDGNNDQENKLMIAKSRNTSVRAIQHNINRDTFEDSIQRLFDNGDFAWDRPMHKEDGVEKPVTPEDSGTLYAGVYNPMARRSIGRMAAIDNTGSYLLNLEKSRLMPKDGETTVVVLETRPGIATYEDYPRVMRFEWFQGRDGFPEVKATFVNTRGWNGQHVTVEQPADFRYWEATYIREAEFAYNQRLGAIALNQGQPFDLLPSSQKEVMAKVSPRDGRYYEPSFLTRNYYHPYELLSWIYAQRYYRSLGKGYSHRLGVIIAGASDYREAQKEGTRERVKNQLGLARRWFVYEQAKLNGEKVAIDLVTEGA
jgi:hypothetical protein